VRGCSGATSVKFGPALNSKIADSGNGFHEPENRRLHNLRHIRASLPQ
jgi:hypothetical protein